jgi:hypothetical protein
MDAYSLQQIEQQIYDLEAQQRDLRRRERNLRMQEGAFSSQPQAKAGPDLRSTISGVLGARQDLMPGNVGGLNTVVWPFWFEMDFDFGVNPLIQAGTAASQQKQSYQVTQEAAFLLMAICRNANSETTSGDLGPWQIDFKDRQSSRQFNDTPIPIQMIGTKSLPTVLPTPMLLMPNAFFDSVMTTWQTTAQATVGSGKHQFTFFGYRVRIQDAQAVMDSVFGA